MDGLTTAEAGRLDFGGDTPTDSYGLKVDPPPGVLGNVVEELVYEGVAG